MILATVLFGTHHITHFELAGVGRSIDKREISP